MVSFISTNPSTQYNLAILIGCIVHLSCLLDCGDNWERWVYILNCYQGCGVKSRKNFLTTAVCTRTVIQFSTTFAFSLCQLNIMCRQYSFMAKNSYSLPTNAFVDSLINSCVILAIPWKLAKIVIHRWQKLSACWRCLQRSILTSYFNSLRRSAMPSSDSVLSGIELLPSTWFC